jgi:DNA polymerase III epsilon subunit family exonuclease
VSRPQARESLPADDFYLTTASSWGAFYLYHGYEPPPRIQTPKVAFLDTETTGLYPEQGHRLIELAMVVRSLDGDTPSEWRGSSLFNPGCPIPAESTAIHGLTDADVAGKPAFASVAERIAKRLEGATIVAHNAPFDVGFLRAEFQLAGMQWQPAAVIDTKAVARRVLPKRRYYGLQDIAKDYAFPTGQAHRAMSDVETLMRLWELLIQKPETLNVGGGR